MNEKKTATHKDENVRRQKSTSKKSPKVSVTIRYSPEVIAYFKSTEKGWKNKMDDALREWTAEHPLPI